MKFSRSLLAMLLFAPFISFGQRNFYEEADKRFASGDYYGAIDLYKSVSHHRDRNVKRAALYKTAYCYMMINDHKQAENYFQKAIKAGYWDPVMYKYHAYTQKYLGMYEDACASYQYYMQSAGVTDESFIATCVSALDQINDSAKYVVRRDTVLSSHYHESSVSFGSGKYDVLFFSSDSRLGDYYLGDGQNIFKSHRADSGWSNPALDTASSSSVSDEGVSYDRRTGSLYFSREVVSKKKRSKVYTYKLFVRDPSRHVQSFPFCYNDTVNFNFITPFAITENELLFSSDMPGGFGGYDLWRVKFDTVRKVWNKPENLGGEINSASHEKYPYVREDGALYFSSNRMEGMGGFDIFRAAQTGEHPWAKPEGLGYPLNSPQDDYGIIFEGMNENGFLLSNRWKMRVLSDIYRFELQK